MSIKILMADGNPHALEMARETMASVQWCDLVTVRDEREATSWLQNQRFDGFITTDRSPGVDGFELVQCARCSQFNTGIPIVMLTEDNDIDTMRRGFKAGVTFFSVKPSNRERFFRLFNAVRGAMETERRRHHRLPYRTSVTCSVGEDGRNRFVAESVEIGEGGISLRPSGGVEVGQVLELEFLMPQLTRPTAAEMRKPRKALFVESEDQAVGPQKVRARVRYVASGGESLGLDFIALTTSQRQMIQVYISGGI